MTAITVESLAEGKPETPAAATASPKAATPAEVKSTPVEGEPTVNASTFGKVRFNPRGRIHTEELVKGAARAIIVELKR